MKRSRQQDAAPAPDMQMVLQFVDEEMAKIVATIDATRPVRPRSKPKGARRPARQKAA